MKMLLGSILCATILAGCGGSANPLVGTWQGSSGLAVITWTFASNQGWTSSVVATDPSTSCVETTDQLGTWTTAGNMLTITASSGTVAVTGCSDASQDQSQHSDPDLDTSARTSTYVISGNTLTDTPMGASSGVVLTRQ